MYQAVYEKLKEVARLKCESEVGRGLITYGEVGLLINLDPSTEEFYWKIGGVVGEVSDYEYRHGRPLLSAVVVNKETCEPGDGFFRLLCWLDFGDCSDKNACDNTLHYCPKKDKLISIWSTWHGVPLRDLDEAWILELKKVHDYWSSH